METEVNAINTAGLWYGHIMCNGKMIWQAANGFANRDYAVEEARDICKREKARAKTFKPSIFDKVD